MMKLTQMFIAMIRITVVEYIIDFPEYAFLLRVSVYVSYIVPFTGIQEIAPLVSCTFVFSVSYFESELSAESSKEFRKRYNLSLAERPNVI